MPKFYEAGNPPATEVDPEVAESPTEASAESIGGPPRSAGEDAPHTAVVEAASATPTGDAPLVADVIATPSVILPVPWIAGLPNPEHHGRELPSARLRFAVDEAVARIDLGGHHCAAICEGDWRVESLPMGKFERQDHQRPLPIPERGGDALQLARLIPLAAESDDFLFVIAWMTAVVLQRLPVPILLVTGPRASGKSRLIRVVRQLLDPVVCPLLPLRGAGLDKALAEHALPAFDHVTKFPASLCEDLSRAVTEGCAHRGIRKAILISTPTAPAGPGDFRDRTLVIDLPPLATVAPEGELSNEFEALRAPILGALLDLAANVMGAIVGVGAGARYRFPDFAQVGRAVALVLRGDAGAFDAALEMKARSRAIELQDGDSLCETIKNFVRKKGEFTGTIRDLRDFLLAAGASPKVVPQYLGSKLRELAPELRSLGVDAVEQPRTSAARTWVVRAMDTK